MKKIITAFLIVVPLPTLAGYPRDCAANEEKVASAPISLNISIGPGGVRVTDGGGPQRIPNHESLNWRFDRYHEFKAKFGEAFAGDADRNRPTADKLDFVLSRALLPPATIKDSAAFKDWIETNYRAEKIKAGAREKFPGNFGDIWLRHEWIDTQLGYLSEKGVLSSPDGLPQGIDGPEFNHWLGHEYINHLVRNRLAEPKRTEMFDALVKSYEKTVQPGGPRPSEDSTYSAVAEVSALMDGFNYARKTQESIGWMREHLQYNLNKHIESKGRIAQEDPEEIARQRARLDRAEKALRSSPWAELLYTFNRNFREGDPYNKLAHEAVVDKINVRVAKQYGLNPNYVNFLTRVFEADEGSGRSSIVIDRILPGFGKGYKDSSFDDFFRTRYNRSP